ncbi:hypothetical protein AAHE18_08G128400 [Arachis hypogaea]
MKFSLATQMVYLRIRYSFCGMGHRGSKPNKIKALLHYFSNRAYAIWEGEAFRIGLDQNLPHTPFCCLSKPALVFSSLFFLFKFVNRVHTQNKKKKHEQKNLIPEGQPNCTTWTQRCNILLLKG